MRLIYTFYSYKGGVGRSMSLANISVLLSKLGYKVLIIDWDLEAPGIDVFFKDFLTDQNYKNKEGIIDLLYKLQKPIKNGFNSDIWLSLIHKIKIAENDNEIHLILSGKKDADYYSKVRTFNIENMYEYNGQELEKIRNDWKNNYDFILIDSRTGITDYGGMCTIHLPDILVLFFVTTEQSLEGIIDIYNKGKEARKKLPFDRKSLVALPILSKFDSSEEYKISQEWIELSSKQLSELYKNWLPKEINIKDFIELTKIPYIPYFSFGEKLAVKEQSSKDPSGIVYAYETLSAMIADKLENVSDIIKNRDSYIREQDRSSKSKSIDQDYKRKVFISYAEKDKHLASELFDRLSDFNLEPWIDFRNLEKGRSVQESIKDSIQESDVFLCIVTKNYNENNARIVDEINYVLDSYQTKLNKSFKIVPLILEKTNIPKILSNFQFFDISKNIRLDELISFITPEYKIYQNEWSKDVEDKWIILLEEGNEVKIKRQMFDLKENIDNCFYDILELEGKEASSSVKKKFWDSINTICIQILVILKYNLEKYIDDLFNFLVDTYNHSVGPYPNLASTDPKGKQAEIWFGIIIRIYLMGAVALSNHKYKFVKKLICVNPLPQYWSKNYWIRHSQIMFTRGKNIQDRNGVVFYANLYLQEFYWIHRFLNPKNDNTLNKLCEFDFLQCIIALKESDDNRSCYPSFGQYYSLRLNHVLDELVSKKNSYEVIREISDNRLADTILKLDDYAEQEYGFYSGYDSNSFSNLVREFLENNRTPKQ